MTSRQTNDRAIGKNKVDILVRLTNISDRVLIWRENERITAYRASGRKACCRREPARPPRPRPCVLWTEISLSNPTRSV